MATLRQIFNSRAQKYDDFRNITEQDEIHTRKWVTIEGTTYVERKLLRGSTICLPRCCFAMDSTQAANVANRITYWQRAIDAISVDGCRLVIFVRQDKNLQVAACSPRDLTQQMYCDTPEDVLGADRVVADFCNAQGQVIGHVGASGVSANTPVEMLQRKLRKLADYIETDLAVHRDGFSELWHESQPCHSNEHLNQSQRHLKTVLDSIGDAVIVTDNRATITHINPVASSLTGWPADEALGCSLGQVLRSRNIDGSEAGVGGNAGVIGAQHSPVALELYLHSRHGTIRRISCSAAPIRRQSQVSDGLVLVFRDTTHEHAVQQKLRQSERLQSIGQLAGGIAHDFNNMLGAIQASGECLQISLEQESEPVQECVDVILGAARKAAQLTGQLLAFARRGQMSTVPIELHTMMNSTLELMSRTVDRRIVLSRSFDATRTIVNGDRSALQSMLLNMAVNASHALVDGGTIAISTRDVQLGAEECFDSSFDMLPGEYCEIEVRDNGKGIEPQDLAKVFDPFYTTKSPGGSGLGLSAAYGTVQDHGGSIEVQSTVGKGTAIRILLPIAADAVKLGGRKSARTSGTAPVRRASKQASRGCVLVVEDEATVRASARLVLTSLGYEVIEAVNGIDGLATYEANQGRVDVVLLDINMPEMNGLECYERLKELDPDVRVVVASGFIDDRYRGAFGECQMIRKPYTVAQLKAAIKSAALHPVS